MRTVLGRQALAKLVASIGVALVLVGCSERSGDRSSSATLEARSETTTGDAATSSTARPRPTAIDASIAVLANGHTRRQVVLQNVQVPPGSQPGTAISIHPTSDPVTIQVPGLPGGGSLLICPVDGPYPAAVSGTTWLRTSEPCSTITSAAPASVSLSRADGNSHVGIEFDGEWPGVVDLAEVRLSYEAVDDHFYVDFALP